MPSLLGTLYVPPRVDVPSRLGTYGLA